MGIIKNNLGVAIVMGVVATLFTAGAVYASTSGVGVENAKPDDRRPSARHHGTRRGHGFIIFYGHRRGYRGRGGSYGGGGFRGGK